MVYCVSSGVFPTQYSAEDPVPTMPQEPAVQYYESEQKQMPVLQVGRVCCYYDFKLTNESLTSSIHVPAFRDKSLTSSIPAFGD